MKKILAFLIVLVQLTLISAQDMSRVRRYVDTLAAPGMHGRGYVMMGDKIAAAYIENQFKEIGLASFSKNNASDHPWFQNFPITINTFPDTLCLKWGNKVLTPGKEFIVHPGSGKGAGSLKIKWLDTSIFCNEKNKKKFLQQDFTRSCLVYYAADLKKYKTIPPDINQQFNSAGCILEVHDKLTASYSSQQLGHPVFQVLKSALPSSLSGKISFQVNARILKNYVSQNVIGFVRGKTNPDSFIVVSAHYDHLGRMGKEVYFPGANDNASGISMLLELARKYAADPPEYSVVFIAFGGEEAGLIGSRFYTQNPLFPLQKIKFLLNLDLLGTGEEGITVVNATEFPAAFDLLYSINEEKKYLAAVKKRGKAANSDHYFFTEYGVPSFFIYTMGGISAYHDVFDRPETLPLTKFQEVYQLLTEFIRRL